METQKKKYTIQDIAKAAGVSKATVSYVLNDKPGARVSDETRNRVLHVANLYNFTPNLAAKYLSSSNTARPVGIIISQRANNAIFAAQYWTLLEALTRELAAEGREAHLLTGSRFNRVPQYIFDAIVAVNLPQQELLALSEHTFVPLILLDILSGDTLFYKLHYDYAAVYREAAEMLGAAEIGVVAGPFCNELFRQYLAEQLPGGDIHFYTSAAELRAFANRCSEQRKPLLFSNETLALRAAPSMSGTPYAVVSFDEAAEPALSAPTIYCPVSDMAKQISRILFGLSDDSTSAPPRDHNIVITPSRPE